MLRFDVVSPYIYIYIYIYACMLIVYIYIYIYDVSNRIYLRCVYTEGLHRVHCTCIEGAMDIGSACGQMVDMFMLDKYGR